MYLLGSVYNLSKIYDMFQELIKKGVDVNCRHPYGWRAIHAAAINSRSQAVKFLLSQGADPNLPDNFSNIFQVSVTGFVGLLDHVMCTIHIM